jgi:Amt family ammonium transporter
MKVSIPKLGSVPKAGALGALASVLLASPALAQELDTGDTAWMLTSTALVLLMTIPGLALFYGGMVRKKNVLATVMQSFAITCLVTVIWTVVGYSLALTEGGAFLGGFDRFLLGGMELDATHSLAGTIPESVFMTFQMTFAIITAALITGAMADRMKFSALLWFIGLWSILVYAPIAHWVWEPGGWLFEMGVLDFAGGTVVHINSGVAALMAAFVLGPRIGYRKENLAPHNVGFTGQRRHQRRHGHGGHPDRHCRCGIGVDVRRMVPRQEAVGARHRVRRCRRPRRHHSGVGLRHPGQRAAHRCDRRRGLLLGGRLAQAAHGL